MPASSVVRPLLEADTGGLATAIGQKRTSANAELGRQEVAAA